MFEKLSDIFVAAAEKYLTAVDAEPVKSNQHEIGGLKKAGIADLLGYPEDGNKWSFPATIVYIGDDSTDPLICEDVMSWYDTRYNKPHRTAEYRLYYRSNDVTNMFRQGDFFLIALTRYNGLLIVVTPPDSDAELQLRSIFGSISATTDNKLRPIYIEEAALVAPIRLMLAELGVEFYAKSVSDTQLLDKMLEKFGSTFPKTKVFSDFARQFLNDKISAIDEPDEALLSWMDYEEKLFRIQERHIVSERLKSGFGKSGHDVDEFIKFSLSVQNRRKSRVGHAFENHITEILERNKMKFECGVYTEGKHKPDFLFPSQDAYLDASFNRDKLFSLAAKTTCKDRWRQVLTEAQRISTKHLITLEPSISKEQTEQMKSLNVKLIIPTKIQYTYTEEQRVDIWSLKNFIDKINS
ncbi:type II restriction endonuclease [Lacimicrobium alkaliphilum]|uniref:Restriction endonuclease type II EcoRII C-terminal domain-containing protein n=1 Tax=Lacimicrobium alkaliphilum TaxID=1526571 RepID=A0A0U2ZDI1_9ALTE|nr:type II restriction endonuclease [Lacimicrobium alkaliphilum]ALS97175.1 hypothetical protein AT746_02020 [Lacimicrobium alkaliphilum]